MAQKPRKNPDTSIEDTGERMVPAYSKGWIVYGEHMARYQSISPLVKGKIVLDIASGSGYGSALIAEQAKHVYGVDISKEAIKYAKKNYGADNIDFIQGDGVKIPLDDGSVDVVVTFETIEHIEAYDQFMNEVKRVLKKGGLLILSTPNDKEYTEENHFHIHEFEKKELDDFVKKYFKNTKMYYQGDWVSSGIFEEKLMTKELNTQIETAQLAPIKLDQSIYFFVLASDEPVTQKIDNILVLSEHYSAKKNRDTEMVFKDHMDKQADIIKHFQNELNHEKEVTALLQKEKRELEKRLHAIRSSLPLRVARKSKRIIKKLGK